MTRILLMLLLYSTVYHGYAQKRFESIFHLPDSMQALTLDNLYASMLQNHPIVKQTNLLTEMARQEVRLARGAFDPKLESKMSLKEYGDKEYYNKWITSITLPSWFPIDPKIGIERNSGIYLDAESSLPSADNYQQLFTGVSLPIGRGLFTDERRAALKQAKLYTQLTEAEQIKLINKILLEAAKDYWQWYFSFYNYRLLTKNTEVASEIFDRVKLNYTYGEASVVDTVQAKIILQQRIVEKQEAYLEFINTGIKISNYLWDDKQMPLQLSDKVVPVLNQNNVILTAETLNELTELARLRHPELQKLNVKLSQLEVDRKLAIEYLKPRLDLNYNFLNQPIKPDGSLQTFTFLNNYKFGLDFSVPLLLRKERSKLAQTKLKIQGTNYELTQTEREIVNQVNSTFNQLQNTGLILNQQSLVASNYERLLDAELMNLENGESDLFKINAQQEKLIQSQSKVVKLKADYEKLKATLYWAAGVHHLNFQQN